MPIVGNIDKGVNKYFLEISDLLIFSEPYHKWVVHNEQNYFYVENSLRDKKPLNTFLTILWAHQNFFSSNWKGSPNSLIL